MNFGRWRERPERRALPLTLREAELTWLKEFRPATPEVERLVRAMLQPE